MHRVSSARRLNSLREYHVASGRRANKVKAWTPRRRLIWIAFVILRRECIPIARPTTDEDHLIVVSQVRLTTENFIRTVIEEKKLTPNWISVWKWSRLRGEAVDPLANRTFWTFLDGYSLSICTIDPFESDASSRSLLRSKNTPSASVLAILDSCFLGNWTLCPFKLKRFQEVSIDSTLSQHV